MPTYSNNTNSEIEVQVAGSAVFVGAHQSIETEFILPTNTGLTQTSEYPYFNPAVALHDVTSSGADQTITIDVDNTRTIRLQKIASATVTLYLQSLSNEPPAVKGQSSTDNPFDIKVRGNVNQVILQFSGAGTCQVMELKH